MHYCQGYVTLISYLNIRLNVLSWILSYSLVHIYSFYFYVLCKWQYVEEALTTIMCGGFFLFENVHMVSEPSRTSLHRSPLLQWLSKTPPPPFSLSTPWFTWWPSNSPPPIISYGGANFFLSLKAKNFSAMWMELLHLLHGLLLLTLGHQTSSTWRGKILTSASWVFCSPPSRRKPWPRSWASPPHARSG